MWTPKVPPSVLFICYGVSGVSGGGTKLWLSWAMAAEVESVGIWSRLLSLANASEPVYHEPFQPSTSAQTLPQYALLEPLYQSLQFLPSRTPAWAIRRPLGSFERLTLAQQNLVDENSKTKPRQTCPELSVCTLASLFTGYLSAFSVAKFSRTTLMSRTGNPPARIC